MPTYNDHDGPICAALGHRVATLTVIYCPHRASWTIVTMEGDDADDRADDSARIDFGPFDTAEDVANEARGRIGQMIRTGVPRWLEARRERLEG